MVQAQEKAIAAAGPDLDKLVRVLGKSVLSIGIGGDGKHGDNAAQTHIDDADHPDAFGAVKHYSTPQSGIVQNFSFPLLQLEGHSEEGIMAVLEPGDLVLYDPLELHCADDMGEPKGRLLFSLYVNEHTLSHLSEFIPLGSAEWAAATAAKKAQWVPCEEMI